MDLDGEDLSYLESGSFVSADLAAAAAAGGGRNGVNGDGAFGQSPTQGAAMDVSGGADMDAIVVGEMRRRSLANGFGLDYLTMGDDEPYSTMVSPTTYSPQQMPHAPSQLATTVEDVMDMTASVPPGIGLMNFGGMSAPELQPTVTMYPAAQDNITPRRSDRSPAVSLSSVPPTPTTVSMGLSPRLPQGSSSMRATPTSDITLSMGQGPGPPSIAEPVSNDRPVGSVGSVAKPIQMQKFPENIYSQSGFNMLDLLNRVANRPNPQINIGAVDMSCAFVVTDTRKFDNPIVYCSATFEKLTGYTKHEVLGRNCRFLQAPNGNIKAGETRKYVDGNAVYYLKSQIENRQEAQTSLINYRKGGQSFTNLLTMIPIPYGEDNEIAYFVGFQVDLVDHPGAMMNKNRDGSYAVNYQYSQLPAYVPAVVLDQRPPRMPTSRDDVSQVLASFGAGDQELHTKRILDKVLLENTDDVVHVLSLKGLFLYCSPSIRKVLEYEPHELVGTSLSAVCHPSDIVPVTRDLKDTSAGISVNVVFRIRRKFSGYTWFESHGCLHTEQGKGRKCIILVGRERPVYVLRWRDVTIGGGIGENELWTKLSTSGMFLYVSSNSKMLLDRDSEELIGTSVQALMRPDSRHEVGKALENARSGTRTNVRHEIQNKRGQFLQALTTLFPGDGNEYRCPTFLIAQTRLLKHTRSSSISSSTSPVHKPPPTSSTENPGSHSSTPSAWSGNSSGQTSTLDGSKPGEGAGKDTSDSSNPDDNMFEELKTTRSTSWQFELRQMQRTNKRLMEELSTLLSSKKKRKRRKGADQLERDCANCHVRVTPEWRRGPSGKRDLCNSCGLRYAKLIGKGSSRTGNSTDKGGTSPVQASPTSTQPTEFASLVATATAGSNSNQQVTPPKLPRSSAEETRTSFAEENASASSSTAVSPTAVSPRSSAPGVLPPLHARRGSMGALSKIPMVSQPRKSSLGSLPSIAGSSIHVPQSEMTGIKFPSTQPAGSSSGSNNESTQ